MAFQSLKNVKLLAGRNLYISWQDKRRVKLMIFYTTETFQKKVKSNNNPNKRRVVKILVALEADTRHMGGIALKNNSFTTSRPIKCPNSGRNNLSIFLGDFL